MSRPIFVNNLDQTIASPAAVEYCDFFLCRLRGLMFRSHLGPDAGLLLVGKRDARLDASIHMFFVPFDLAVFWIDTNLTVVDKILARSWRPAYLPKQPACYILELHPRRLDDYQIGHKVKFTDA
jgi:uncharacterized membrane protein (UPF0127 family)